MENFITRFEHTCPAVYLPVTIPFPYLPPFSLGLGFGSEIGSPHTPQFEPG